MMYRLHVRDPTVAGVGRAFTVNEMARKMALAARPASKERVGSGKPDPALETRARVYRARAPYSPVYLAGGRIFPPWYVGEAPSHPSA